MCVNIELICRDIVARELSHAVEICITMTVYCDWQVRRSCMLTKLRIIHSNRVLTRCTRWADMWASSIINETRKIGRKKNPYRLVLNPGRPS